jgi:hypothetical protein
MRHKLLLAIAAVCLAFCLCPAIPRAQAAFDHFNINSMRQVRDADGAVVGLRVEIEIFITGRSESEKASFKIEGQEYQNLVALTAGQRRAQLVAIAKREAHVRFDRWVAEIQSRPQPEVARDVATDFGVVTVSTFAGEAAPTPTP